MTMTPFEITVDNFKKKCKRKSTKFSIYYISKKTSTITFRHYKSKNKFQFRFTYNENGSIKRTFHKRLPKGR